MNRQMEACMDGWMDRWMSRCMEWPDKMDREVGK